jgi:hypothetical protein
MIVATTPPKKTIYDTKSIRMVLAVTTFGNVQTLLTNNTMLD